MPARLGFLLCLRDATQPSVLGKERFVCPVFTEFGMTEAAAASTLPSSPICAAPDPRSGRRWQRKKGGKAQSPDVVLRSWTGTAPVWVVLRGGCGQRLSGWFS